MSGLTFALIAMHGGAVYVVDSRLTESDCRAFTAPGVVTFFEVQENSFVIPDATTRFECHVELGSSPAHVPDDGAGARKLSGDAPRVIRYGQPAEFWNANPVALPRLKHRHHAAPGAKRGRGRPPGS